MDPTDNLRGLIFRDRYKIFKTFLTYITFAGLGGINTLIGSSLLDIQIHVGRSFEATSQIVPIRSIGYVIGASMCGFFEKFLDDFLVLSISNLIAGLSLIAAPWFESLELVSVFIFITGLALGVFDIYCNVIVLRIWGANAVNWLQVLHMFFGLGALITPIFTRPFLLPNDETNQESNELFKVNETNLETTTISSFILSNDESIDNQLNISSSVNSTIGYQTDDIKVQYAFMIVGGILTLVSIPYFICYLIDRKDETESRTEVPTPRFGTPNKYKKAIAIVITAFLANFAFGTEAVVGNLCTAFAVKADVHMDKQKAVLVATVFWTMFSFYRLIFIPLTIIIKESRLFIFNLFIILAGVVTLVPKAASNQLFTWISFTLLGIGYSPVFSISYGYLARYFPVTKAITSFIFVNGVIGETIHTTVLSRFIETKPIIFTYYLGSMGIIYVALSFALPFYCRKFCTRKT